MSNPSLKKPRELSGDLLSKLPSRLSHNVAAVIDEITRGTVNPWRMWELLTDIRNRLGMLTEDDETLLHRFGVLRRIDLDMRFDPDQPQEVELFLTDLAAPHVEVQEAVLDAFSLTPDLLAESLCQLGSLSSDTAHALLAGRIATAKRIWSGVSPDEQAALETPFTEIVADLLNYYLLDSLWQAGHDAARRHFCPTGSPIIDGDGKKEAKLGAIDDGIREIEVAIGVLDRIAAEKDEIKQKEAIETVFAPILGFARRYKSELEREHGKALGSLLKTWDTAGRAIALSEAARIRTAIEKERQAAGPKGRGAVGRRDYKTYVGGVGETLYLAFQCGAWWSEERRAPAVSKTGTVITEPQPTTLPPSFRTLYVAVQAFAVNNSRGARKHIAERLREEKKKSGPSETLQALFAAIDKDPKTYVTELTKPAHHLWERRKSLNDWERRCFETECFGRFWLRLHL
ncbi:hypothetical protein HZF05_13705 [Sphingomonas sp. CGMCC 1.13654]|uniref:Uncharacterized protein n=1 Tax=Sphingomonas chungangi TaxID=2683589 RepID=A0A838L8A3_9SPHN|nr:hypothetical protein [Sphingomonas chungangi]MBA2935140.1 hypothetical protein [Sphingomonas chungangi]MVW57704.1 hypothetical protein [Sphingomonas chungangi]